VHERVSLNSLCLYGAPLPEVARGFAELAPRRVSFTADLVTGDPAAVRELVRSRGYAVETVGLAFVSGHLDPAPDSWARPRAALDRAIDAAVAIGARSVYVVTGGHGELTWEQAAECFSAAIEPCVAHARDAGIALATENASLQTAHLHIAHSLRDALTLAELAGIDVCIDLYACWAEAGLRETLARAVPRCALVQVGDYVYGDPVSFARAVPGDGAIPLGRLLSWLEAAGYRGAYDLELIGPRIDAEGHVAAARRAAACVGELLESLDPASASGITATCGPKSRTPASARR
jgi:sugar phosphate isomerase/epimerase